jgi:hypothetical protein
MSDPSTPDIVDRVAWQRTALAKVRLWGAQAIDKCPAWKTKRVGL